MAGRPLACCASWRQSRTRSLTARFLTRKTILPVGHSKFILPCTTLSCVPSIHDRHQHLNDLQDDTNIFRNYADDEDTFYDGASTALMAATVYRLSQVWDDQSFIPNAERSRKALYASGSTSSFAPTSTTSGASPSSTVPSGLQHFTADGWLTPVVNPHSYGNEGSESAEGQAFVLMMQAAYQDWVDAGSPGNDGIRLRSSSWCTVIALALVMTVLL